MNTRITLAIVVACLPAIAGCSREKKSETAAPVRPVLSAVVRAVADRPSGFAGIIQAQYQTERGFRVLGRIIARYVYVGDVVKAGQRLAQLDPLPFELAVRSSEADLARAKSQLANAAGAEARSGTLLGKDVVTKAEYDTKEQARAAADASVQQAEANLDKAREQRDYATLTADIDGVVTSTDADVGQIASPGKKVMTLARLDIREAVVDLPEDVTRSLTTGMPFTISLQADPSVRTKGKVREIAPQADSATRTYRVRMTLESFTEAFRLGATVTATPLIPSEQSPLEIPRSALLERDGSTRVWLVDTVNKSVRTVPVKIAAGDGENVQIAEGLAAGARVVIAGVNSLSEGQAVKFEERTSP